MERTLISLNIPNFLTIGLMAVGFFLIAAVAWQLIQQFTGSGGDDGGGETMTISTGGEYDAAVA